MRAKINELILKDIKKTFKDFVDPHNRMLFFIPQNGLIVRMVAYKFQLEKKYFIEAEGKPFMLEYKEIPLLKGDEILLNSEDRKIRFISKEITTEIEPSYAIDLEEIFAFDEKDFIKVGNLPLTLVKDTKVIWECVSKERDNLKNVHFEFTEKGVEIIASDGYWLGYLQSNISIGNLKINIPPKILKVMSFSTYDFEIWEDKEYLKLQNTELKIIFSKETEYPNYHSVFPQEFKYIFKFPDDFIKSLKYLSPNKPKKDSLLIFDFPNEKILLKSIDRTIEVKFPFKTYLKSDNYPNFSIAFDFSYIYYIASLKLTGFFYLNSNENAAIFDFLNLKFLVMPQKLD